MPFIRHARDKRGYEQTFVMHAYRPGQGASRARVLYMFRSPANVKVGRRPLDPEVIEALEHTHPDLSFDWTAVPKEPEPPRPDPRDRDRDRGRRPPPAALPPPARSRPPAERQPAAPIVAVVLEDESLLGRTLGAEAAARLRARHGELLQRIARRARTPEDRDRLTEHVQRLNPDEWPDEAAIRTGATTVQAEWEVIAAELPQRHRGRRGGRNRSGRPEAGDPAGPSVIIGKDGNGHGDAQDADRAGEDRSAGDRRDGGRIGTGHAEADPAEPARDDLPGGG